MTATSLVILLKLYEDHRFFVPYDLAMWWMTSKYNRAPFLCHVKLCMLFQSEWWNQIGVTVGNTQFWSKSTIFCPQNLTNDLDQSEFEGFDSCNRPSNLKLDSNRQFSACVTVKFDGWPRKTIGHFFFTTSSLVHHSKSIGEFKLHLQSRNAQFGSNLVIFYPVWPWNLMNDIEKQ